MNLAEVIEELKTNSAETLESQQTVEDHVVDIHAMMGTLIAGNAKGMASLYNVLAKIHNVLVESLRRAHDQADMRQDRQELSALGGSQQTASPIPESDPSISRKEPKKDTGIDLMDFLLAGGLLYTFRKQIGAATSAMLRGIQSSVVTTLETIGHTIHATALSIIEGKMGARAISRMITSSRLYSAITNILTSIQSGFSRMATAITNFGKSIRPFFNRTLKTIQTIIGGILRPIAAIFNAVTGRLAHILSFVPRIAGWLAGVIRIVAMPITILMGIWEAYKGAQERLRALESSDVLDRGLAMLVGGLEGLVKFLVGYPLDLIKTITGWAAEKLGYANVKDKLESFSFTDILGSMFDVVHFGLSNFINGFRDTFGKLFSGDFRGAGASYIDMITRPVNAIMQYVLSKLKNVPVIGAAIPDTFYRKFGVDPETGAKTIDYTPPGARTTSDEVRAPSRKEATGIRHSTYLRDKNALFGNESLSPPEFDAKSREVLRKATELNSIDKTLVSDKELITLKTDINQMREQIRREKEIRASMTSSEVSKTSETMKAHKVSETIRTNTETNRLMGYKQAMAPVVVAAPTKTNNTVNQQNVSLTGARISTSDDTEVASSYSSRFSGR